MSTAIDRSLSCSVSDARDALVNAVVDSLESYRSNISNVQQTGVIAPSCLRLFPLYTLALLKQVQHSERHTNHSSVVHAVRSSSDN